MITLSYPIVSVSKKDVTFSLFTVLFLLIFSAHVYGQESNQEEIYIVADEMPVFPGGTKALLETIQKHITYPPDAFENGIEGKVILKFAVSSEGKAIKPTIAKGLSPSIDKVVLEAVDKLPNFEPAKLKGKPVSVWYAVPVTFQITKL